MHDQKKGFATAMGAVPKPGAGTAGAMTPKRVYGFGQKSNVAGSTGSGTFHPGRPIGFYNTFTRGQDINFIKPKPTSMNQQAQQAQTQPPAPAQTPPAPKTANFNDAPEEVKMSSIAEWLMEDDPSYDVDDRSGTVTFYTKQGALDVQLDPLMRAMCSEFAKRASDQGLTTEEALAVWRAMPWES